MRVLCPPLLFGRVPKAHRSAEAAEPLGCPVFLLSCPASLSVSLSLSLSSCVCMCTCMCACACACACVCVCVCVRSVSSVCVCVCSVSSLSVSLSVSLHDPPPSLCILSEAPAHRMCHAGGGHLLQARAGVVEPERPERGAQVPVPDPLPSGVRDAAFAREGPRGVGCLAEEVCA